MEYEIDYDAEDAAIKRDRIRTFCQKNSLSYTISRTDSCKMLHIFPQGLAPDIAVEQIITDSYARIRKQKIAYNCYPIAAINVKTKSANGIMHTANGATEFVNTINHAVSLTQTDASHFMAIDYTAGVNIDEDQGYFQVLTISANSVAQLVTHLNSLYGGNWRTLADDEIALIYALEYPDSHEILLQALQDRKKRHLFLDN